MPAVFRYKGFRFFFYSNEGSPREPVHIHVRGEGGEAKFWLQPAVRVATSDGLDAAHCASWRVWSKATSN